MGFGYLFIGYLITFLLYFVVQAFHVGGLALLIGFGTMMLGLWELTHYQKAFVYAKWLCIPLLCVSGYQLAAQLGEFFLWNSVLFGDTVTIAVGWVYFALLVAFHFSLYYAIYTISREVELKHLSSVALRNMVFYALYAILYSLNNATSLGVYINFSAVLMEVVCIVLNLALLISCTKNICAEGDEDVPQKPHRWAFVNKLNSVYDRARQKNIDQARADGEAIAERRRQRKANKKKRK